MVAIKLELLLFINILYVTDGVRRITGGKKTTADKSYVVYLVKAPHSNKKYDEWLCGGALVSKWFIITSAACVADVEYMYAIAGYKEYIPDEEIENNPCTKNMKKKVTYTCVPLRYELDYNQVEKWSFIDIALVKVESEYSPTDTTFKTSCSYTPTPISINYIERFQKSGTDTLVYGWGHSKSWRGPDDKTNHNERFMQFASSKVLDKPLCKKHFEKFTSMSELIDKYMICTLNQGEFNDEGEFIALNPAAKLEGCKTPTLLNAPVLVNGEILPSLNTSVISNRLGCEDDDDTDQDSLIDRTRRGDEDTNQTSSGSLLNKNRTVFNRTTRRKYGICQNDHGGPLVTWVGGHEILIGVASVFKVNADLNCYGPYLYTSTQCNGAFLNCILNEPSLRDNRWSVCNSPPIQRGYETVERYISWEHHPSGPAFIERNASAKHEEEGSGLKSPQASQKLLRTYQMLVKMAKDQSTPILRGQRV